MIKRILRRWSIEKRSSFMIGDNLKDKQAAVKSNLYFEYALPNFESQIKNLILDNMNRYYEKITCPICKSKILIF